jgi:hypothetical protein
MHTYKDHAEPHSSTKSSANGTLVYSSLLLKHIGIIIIQTITVLTKEIHRSTPGLRNVLGTGTVLLLSCETLKLSPLLLPRFALLPLLPVTLAGAPPIAATAAVLTGSKALLIPSGKKLLSVVPVGNNRLLSTSSLCAAREVAASTSETLTM